MDTFFFTLGYYIQLVASLLLGYQMSKSKKGYGLSFETQACFAIANIVRCFWTLETRLVTSWLAYAEMYGSTVLSLGIVYLCWRFRCASDICAPRYLSVYSLVTVALVLGFFFHDDPEWITSETAVAFTMYLEAIAMVPQLWVMRKVCYVESVTSHYVGLLVVARFCRVIFWVLMYSQGEHYLRLLVADVLHCICAADYLRIWVRKLNKRGALLLDLSMRNLNFKLE